MNILRRIYWTLSIYRECNRPANYTYWTTKEIGPITLGTAWRASRIVC